MNHWPYFEFTPIAMCPCSSLHQRSGSSVLCSTSMILPDDSKEASIYASSWLARIWDISVKVYLKANSPRRMKDIWIWWSRLVKLTAKLVRLHGQSQYKCRCLSKNNDSPKLMAGICIFGNLLRAFLSKFSQPTFSISASVILDFPVVHAAKSPHFPNAGAELICQN